VVELGLQHHIIIISDTVKSLKFTALFVRSVFLIFIFKRTSFELSVSNEIQSKAKLSFFGEVSQAGSH